jgi:hypothetical protein
MKASDLPWRLSSSDCFGYHIGSVGVSWLPVSGQTGEIYVSVKLSNRNCELTPSLTANAILTSITVTAPFNGTSDSNTAIAYLSIILLMFSVRPCCSCMRSVCEA